MIKHVFVIPLENFDLKTALEQSYLKELYDTYGSYLNDNKGLVMGAVPNYFRFTNPFTGEPFVSEKTISKAVSAIRAGLHHLPPSAKQRIAIKVVKAQKDLADGFAMGFVRGKSSSVLESTLEEGGLLVRYGK